MDANTKMFIGFLIVDAMVFLPMILFGVIGCIITKRKLREVERDLERLNGGR